MTGPADRLGRSAALPRGYARGEGTTGPPRPVWVDLEALFPPAPDAPERPPVPDGLVLTGEVRGLLHHWARAADGRWIAVVSFRLPFGPEQRSSPGLEVRWCPVPAGAVRPEQPRAVRPEQPGAVRPEQPRAVRPEQSGATPTGAPGQRSGPPGR